MVSYLLKILALFIFSIIVIYNYYTKYSFHIESFNWYTLYAILLLLSYWIYKAVQISTKNDKDNKASFRIVNLFFYFLVHLFIICIFFFYTNGASIFYSFNLFFQIIFYSFVPILFVLIWTSLWKKILSTFINEFTKESRVFVFITSLSLWFVVFASIIVILWIFSLYNIVSILALILASIWFSYKEFLSVLNWLNNFEFKIDWNIENSPSLVDRIGLKLISSEFLFIISTLILSVNLVNIMRPMPIGWDDLWVYMNIPNLITNYWWLDWIWWMITWQMLTWIGYVLWSPTQAFFINNIGGFLSFIFIWLIVWEFLKKSEKKEKTKSLINIPLLVSTIFVSMPMVIFQQAKDMKLDTGLFFISISAIYIIYYLYAKKIQNTQKKDASNNNLIYYLIIWLIAGFAFSIKLTSLILISWIFWLIFYINLWTLWILWYIWLFLSLFTWAWIWSRMNVVWLDDTNFKIIFSIISLLIWLTFIWLASFKNKENLIKVIKKSLLVLAWIILALSPWLGKNIVSSSWDLSMQKILFWTAERFEVNYENILSKEELEDIEKKYKTDSIKETWTTNNEDFWRYFWYEEWVNNYLKLPWNLSMQSNQNWEYTDITYIFLALIPVIILFLPFRRSYFSFGVLALLIFELIFFISPLWKEISKLFSQIKLPFWYLVIIWFFSLFLILNTLIKNNFLNKIFKANIVFTMIYVFLWSISAYWIVWYWIVMYFWFLFIISIWWYYLTSYKDDSLEKEKIIKLFWSLVFILIPSLYFLSSSVPHAFKNIKSSSVYMDYKKWQLTVNEAIFVYHPEYLKMLFEMNIKDESKKEFIDEYVVVDEVKNFIKQNNYYDITQVVSFLNSLLNDSQSSSELKNKIKISKENIYKNVTHPNEKYKSDVIVYRLWTFLKYYITDNNKRLFEDSLLNQFDKYIYTWNYNNTIENIKKLWVKYILTDLNAATIDNDPRRDLTRRYENLLKTFTSDKIELIDTDSVCLKIALEEYNKSEKKAEDFGLYLVIWWVNYNSYNENAELTLRSIDKLTTCFKHIYNLYQNDMINTKDYNYLLLFKNYLDSNNIKDEQQIYNVMNSIYNQWFKALFKIKND